MARLGNSATSVNKLQSSRCLSRSPISDFFIRWRASAARPMRRTARPAPAAGRPFLFSKFTSPADSRSQISDLFIPSRGRAALDQARTSRPEVGNFFLAISLHRRPMALAAIAQAAGGAVS
jgi:hypothetical protein